MCAPDKPSVVKGTGGLRKIRFAPAPWATGKSGAARVCYVYFEEFSIVLLIAAYSKKEKENISAAHKSAYKQLIGRAHHLLQTRTYRYSP